MRLANIEIRNRAMIEGVPLWRIADRLGVHDSNFSRLLRKELPDDKKAEIIRIIEDLAKKTEVING